MREDARKNTPPPMGGVHIVKGQRVSVARFTITIGDDGSLSSDLALHLSLDMCPYWLSIAVAHVTNAQRQHADVLAAWSGSDESLRADALEAEFESSMQAIAAAGIAIDALYAAVKEHCPPPIEVVVRWKENKTARYKQVTEVLRSSFKMGNRSAVNLRQAVKQIYRFRDFTVHPPADARAPVRYEELGVATDWRFETFRWDIARQIVGLAISIVAQLVEAPRDDNPALAEYARTAAERVSPILQRWELAYGPLGKRGTPQNL